MTLLDTSRIVVLPIVVVAASLIALQWPPSVEKRPPDSTSSVALQTPISTLPAAPPALTSLSDPRIDYRVPSQAYVVLRRGDIEAVIVDNRAVNDAVLPGHRAGYSGVGALTHTRRPENLFVPAFSGLNFEHIHDGTVQEQVVLFEPRNAPMQLRVVDPYTAELYQAPTPHFGLESCHRYRLLDDGAIELTFEAIPHRTSFTHNYIGLFWASYIQQPESLDTHFKGFVEGEAEAPRWIQGSSSSHGVLATHLGQADRRTFPHEPEFPLTLVFNRSRYRYTEPWYYGISHGMALVFVFRPQDQVRLSQSPSGGGTGNPAWDFQYFIPDYEIGRRYQLIMRALYVEYESPEQIERISAPHRKALGGL